VAKKESRGLPPDFDLKLPTDKPVELGDYLDEEAGQSSGPTPPPADAPAAGSHQPPLPPPPPVSISAGPSVPVSTSQPFTQRAYLSRQQLRPGAVPRKQLNATPETMRMLDELLMQIRQQSMEKDVRTSEIFHAMVLCVYEARAYLDLSAIPPRGRWGSPTAASLPVALKNAFMDAISRTRPRR
jgi:hypothetical protein